MIIYFYGYSFCAYGVGAPFLLGREELVAQHGLEQDLLVVDRCLDLKYGELLLHST